MFYHVYFLESINKPDRHYIGFTKNLKKRLFRPNSGLVKSTKTNKPWKIIYAEAYLEKTDALGREKFLKSGSGWKYLQKQLKNYLNNKQNKL